MKIIAQTDLVAAWSQDGTEKCRGGDFYETLSGVFVATAIPHKGIGAHLAAFGGRFDRETDAFHLPEDVDQDALVQAVLAMDAAIMAASPLPETVKGMARARAGAPLDVGSIARCPGRWSRVFGVISSVTQKDGDLFEIEVRPLRGQDKIGAIPKDDLLPVKALSARVKK